MGVFFFWGHPPQKIDQILLQLEFDLIRPHGSSQDPSTTMNQLKTQLYLEQNLSWPRSGRHIMAQFDEESVIVYQAFPPSIALYAIENQHFGGDFSLSRMSWVKPNFLWMMYRADWACKHGQEYILAVKIRRPFFEEILENAVASSFNSSGFNSQKDWQAAIQTSDVRLQWDPDHDPLGYSVDRRAIQLGLRGEMLRRYCTEEVMSIHDITPFVSEQRKHLGDGYAGLLTPTEQIFRPFSEKAARAVMIDE